MRTSAIAIAAATLASAASAQDIVQAQNEWFVAGQGTIEEMLALQPNTNTARNVILFVADGNDVSTNYATRIYAGQQAGGLGDDHVLPHETFRHMALVKTYTTNGQTPDSAPTAAALNTGVKMKNDVINVHPDVAVDDCQAAVAGRLTTLAEIASAMGKSVGIVSTARLTHATPAAVFGYTANRDWEDNTSIPEGCDQPDLAAQLIEQMNAGVIDLAMGGGRAHFLPAEVTDEEGEAGLRTDGRNLVEEITQAGGQYAWNDETFMALTAPGNGPVLALFESSHMQYAHDRTGEPTQAEMTAAAIEALEQNEGGYYLMSEGGRVDHANHAGNVHRTVTDGVAFAEAVQTAMDMTDPAETLIIVTADHGHAIAFNGYCGRGTPITGLCMDVDPAGEEHTGEPVLADDGKPFSVVGFLNGAGSVMIEQADGSYFGTRPNATQEEATDPDYLQQALIPMGSETHSGTDVAAFARGPWAHLVGGVIEQNVIFHVMLHAITGGEGIPTEAMDALNADAPAEDAADAATTGEADDTATAGDEGTAEDQVEDEAQDAAEELPDEATAEPLEEAAEEAAAEESNTADTTTEGEAGSATEGAAEDGAETTDDAAEPAEGEAETTEEGATGN
jgi:alkaline phosphatase